ncbi:hypothetical protein MKW98_015736 [Papaver atlanticum]|uniref:Uncharacterized protein n=1 Tax=Papaver atlanticum TaxID=357466 RepID=A0AAD4SLU0_9MAGN|nr:hypothetical protein MKW98_015736 [Papaver atlanticum]
MRGGSCNCGLLLREVLLSTNAHLRLIHPSLCPLYAQLESHCPAILSALCKPSNVGKGCFPLVHLEAIVQDWSFHWTNTPNVATYKSLWIEQNWKSKRLS